MGGERRLGDFDATVVDNVDVLFLDGLKPIPDGRSAEPQPMGNGHVAFPLPTAIAEIPLKLLTEAQQLSSPTTQTTAETATATSMEERRS